MARGRDLDRTARNAVTGVDQRRIVADYAIELPLMGVYHPETTYLEEAPTAQLTCIDAGHRLFSVPLTRITSVPECAVPSVGFLWGSAPVSRTCGVSVGLAEAPDLRGRTDAGNLMPESSDLLAAGLGQS
jgi:hypothetical protein